MAMKLKIYHTKISLIISINKKKHIHTKSVKELITTNKTLNTVPPEINNSDKTLPRKTRTTLAQLRSSYSNYLNSYKHRINPEIEDKYPHCQVPHTTIHIFKCPNNIKTLEVRDLWTNPGFK